MGETCAVCKKGKGPEKCEVCGFSDNGFINRQFPISEDAKNWIETVVKPYRVQWEKSEMPSLLKETMLANLREMVKLQRAAHDSMFKFSIKKMWPISLIAPQVDWIRIDRMMGQLQTTCKEQKEFLARERGNAPETDLPFLNLLPEYFDSLAKVAQLLAQAATYRQNALEKKIKMSIGQWNSILKAYNEASDNMAKTGITLYKVYES